MEKNNYQLKRFEHNNRRKTVFKVFFSILLLIAVVVGSGYLYIRSALNPVSPNSNTKTIIGIPTGSTAADIAAALQSKGIIKSAFVFKYYVKFEKDKGFIAGTYQLSPAMNVPDIISRLQSGNVNAAVTITIPEGTQLKEIAHIIAKDIHKPEAAVLKQLNDRDYIKNLIAHYPNLLSNEILNSKIIYPLEGYLFPATYPFYDQNPSVNEIVSAMLDKTNQVLAGYHVQIKQRKLTVHQLLTMSSLIEEEATKKADRTKIASVFYNRIKQGMPLQTDPTVLYAEGKHKAMVFYKDLEVNSPYNTYKNKGLPPGPISNAGKTSIDAALYPASTNYYYFLATSDGSVIFSKTLNQHNQEKAKYISS